MIKKWQHFDTVNTFPFLDTTKSKDWTKEAASVFDDLKVFNIHQDKDLLDVHFAMVLAFRSVEGLWQSFLYSPHGIDANSSSIDALSKLHPPLQPFVMMHGVNRVDLPFFLGGLANRGVTNGMALAKKQAGLKWWLASHDEDKPRVGLTGFFQKTIAQTWDHPIDEMEERIGIKCRVVENGQTLVLAN